MPKWLRITIRYITLGISWAMEAYHAWRMFAKSADLNKDGKTSLDEFKQATKDIKDGKAVLEVRYLGPKK